MRHRETGSGRGSRKAARPACLVVLALAVLGPGGVAAAQSPGEPEAGWDRSEEIGQPDDAAPIASLSLRVFGVEYFGDAGLPGGRDYVSVPISAGWGLGLAFGLLPTSFLAVELRGAVAWAGLGDHGTLRDVALDAVGRLAWRDWTWTPVLALGGSINIPSDGLRGGMGGLVEAGLARNAADAFSVEVGAALRVLGYQPVGPGLRGELYLRVGTWL